MYSFGSGVLIGTRTDVANATPVNFGLVQEVTIEEAATVKELYGQFPAPDRDRARHGEDHRQGQGGAHLRPRLRQPVLRRAAAGRPGRHRLRRGGGRAGGCPPTP